MNLFEFNLKLQYHDKLNPILWNGENLKIKVREKLLEIAEVWREFSKIPNEAILDVVITGGNVNYNYTSKSDIDLHLIVDKRKIFPFYDSNPSFLDDYLMMKKSLWAKTHNITIYGYSIELYAQDISEKDREYKGVYSILDNRWVLRPKFMNLNFSDKNLINKVKFYMNEIDSLIKSQASKESFDDLRKKIANMRKSGLEKGGEFGEENLIFKELRNQGYLDKMTNYRNEREDKNLSLF